MVTITNHQIIHRTSKFRRIYTTTNVPKIHAAATNKKTGSRNRTLPEACAGVFIVAGVIDAVVVVVDVFAIVVATVVVVVVEVGAVVAAVVVAAVVVVVEIELALRTQSLPSYRNREHTKSTFESPNDISQWPSPILLFIICCGRQTAKL